jgi:hypothetical protein
VLSLRRGVGVVARKRYGYPNDFFNCRLNNSAAHWVFQTRHPSDTWKLNLYVPYSSARRRRQVRPEALRARRQAAARSVLCFVGRGSVGRRSAQARINRATERLTKDLLDASGGTLRSSSERSPTSSSGRWRRGAAGKRRRSLASTASASVSRRHRYEPDLVILCTGFDAKVPFLDEALTRGPRFLEAFVPSVGASLGFIGFLRPCVRRHSAARRAPGTLVRVAPQRQGRVAAEAEMRASIERLRGFRRHYFRRFANVSTTSSTSTRFATSWPR